MKEPTKIPLQKRSTVLCVVCGSERELVRTRIVWWRTSGKSLLCGLSIGMVAGCAFSLSFGCFLGVLSAGLSFLGFEVYDNLMFKRELECPVCHFDPVLYRRDPKSARARCEKKLSLNQELFHGRLETRGMQFFRQGEGKT